MFGLAIKRTDNIQTLHQSSLQVSRVQGTVLLGISQRLRNLKPLERFLRLPVSSCLSSVLGSCCLRILAMQHLNVCASELRPKQYFFIGRIVTGAQGHT